jgi:hypothetical protein
MYEDYDEFSLGTTPTDENCARTGKRNCRASAKIYANTKIEAGAFIAQLKRTFGEPPLSAFFKFVFCPHVFGMYYDVVIRYDTKDQEAIDYAKRCDAETPKSWDAKARKELKEKGYSLLK